MRLAQTHILAMILAAGLAGSDIISETRRAARAGRFAEAEQQVQTYLAQSGITPEAAEAVSWLAREALAANQLDRAEGYARQARELAENLLNSVRIEQNRHLEIALGAAIEVEAQVLARRGQLTEAVALLEQELQRWKDSPLHARIQKNIHLLSLRGKPAPPLELSDWIGSNPPSFQELRGKTVLLFFWAHWCPDCRAQVPALERLHETYRDKGLVIVAPTQPYGFTSRGQPASREEEKAYIGKVWQERYAALAGFAPVPVSEANFKRYGASTTPTLVLIDRQGIVRLYHPGNLDYEELAKAVESCL